MMLLDGPAVRYVWSFSSSLVLLTSKAKCIPFQVQEVEDFPEDAARWTGEKVSSSSLTYLPTFP